MVGIAMALANAVGPKVVPVGVAERSVAAKIESMQAALRDAEISCFLHMAFSFIRDFCFELAGAVKYRAIQYFEIGKSRSVLARTVFPLQR